jgi:hypothetical protein
MFVERIDLRGKRLSIVSNTIPPLTQSDDFEYRTLPERELLEKHCFTMLTEPNEISQRYFMYYCRQVGDKYSIDAHRMMALVVIRFFSSSKIDIVTSYYSNNCNNPKNQVIISLIQNIVLYCKQLSHNKPVYIKYVHSFCAKTGVELVNQRASQSYYESVLHERVNLLLEFRDQASLVVCIRLVHTQHDIDMLAKIVGEVLLSDFIVFKNLCLAKWLYEKRFSLYLKVFELVIKNLQEDSALQSKANELLHIIKLRKQVESYQKIS